MIKTNMCVKSSEECGNSVGAMVNSVVESSMDISGEFCEVHVLQDLDEGCPGDGLESLVV